MASSSVRALLKGARESLQKKEYREALEKCKSILKEDKTCYEAFVFVGKAAYHLSEYQQAEAAYTRATALDPNNLLAWQGLAELHTETGTWAKVFETYTTLHSLASNSPDANVQARAPGFARKAAEAAVQANMLAEAAAWWKQLLDSLPAGEEVSTERLEVLCRLCDAQLAMEEAGLAHRLSELSHLTGGDMAEVMVVEGELAQSMLEVGPAANTLRDIMAEAPPSPLFSQYYDAYLQLLRKAAHGAPVGSMDRHSRRCAVLSFALHTIHGISGSGKAGGCCITSPYEVALAMLEVEGNVAAGGGPSTRASHTGTQPGNFTPTGGGSIPASPRPADLAPLSLGHTSRQASGSLAHLPVGPALLNTSNHWAGGGGLSILDKAASAACGVPGAGSDIQLSGMEHVAKRLTHAFPWSAAANVHLALCIRRRSVGLGPAPAPHTPRGPAVGGLSPQASNNPLSIDGHFSPNAAKLQVTDLNAVVPPAPRTRWLTAAARRRRLIKLLLGGLRKGAAVCPSASGWLAAAELLLEEGAPEAALDAAKQGLTYLANREQMGHESLVQADLLLKLAAGRALAAMAGVAPGHTGYILEVARGVLAAPAMPHLPPAIPVGLPMSPSKANLNAADSSTAGASPRECPAALKARVARMASEPLGPGAEEAAAWLGGLLLRGRIGGGPTPFAKQAGSVAAGDLTQQATRCLAQLALVRGDVPLARQLYESLVAAAALGRVDPGNVPHWAAAEYAALLAAQGDCMAAMRQIEQGSRTLANSMPESGEDSRSREHVAIHHALAARYHLLAGWLCYQLGGDYRMQRGAGAHKHLLAAAAEAEAVAARVPEPGHPAAIAAREDAADAFSLLGVWYQECGEDTARAAKCFQRALHLDPAQEVAGESLVTLMLPQPDAAATIRTLCETCIANSMPVGTGGQALPAATWAVRVLGSLQLQSGEAAAAVVALQQALRAAPSDTRLWELLGSAYQQLGRHSAALRSYTRALQLSPTRLYCLVQSGLLQLQQGLLMDALHSFNRAVQLQPGHPAARLGAAEVLLATAIRHVTSGALSLAGSALRDAAAHASACVRAHGNIQAGWKLVGDILLQHADIPVIPPLTIPVRMRKSSSSQAGTPRRSLSNDGPTGNSGLPATTAPTPGPGLTPPDAAAAYVNGCQENVKQRLAALKRARRAYASALHLDPTQAHVWGDAAMAVHQAARLQCVLAPSSSPTARARMGSDNPDNPPAAHLFHTADRLARSGLRLDPSSDVLWGLAGELAASYAYCLPLAAPYHPAPAPQGSSQATTTWLLTAPADWSPPTDTQLCSRSEFCLSRALQLNPRRGPAWAALSRLYAARGEKGLAAAAAEKCRLVEPRLVAVWEAMAALTAGECQDVTALAYKDALDAWEHAVGLGGAPESWQGYATGAIVAGQASLAYVFSTALKAVAQMPMQPAAHNTLGLAYEARGQPQKAVQEYRIALALLSHSNTNSTMNTWVLPTAPDAGLDTAAGNTQPMQVEAALKLNLARALSKSGHHVEAVFTYEGLVQQGGLQQDVPSLIAYGSALMQAGNIAEATAQIETALKTAEARIQAISSTAASNSNDMRILWRQLLGSCLACVHAYLKSDKIDEALVLTHKITSQLPPDLPQMSQLALHIWLVVLTAAATESGEQSNLDLVASQCLSWALQQQPQLDAQVRAHIHGAHAAAASAAGQPRKAFAHAAAAMHSCPWEPSWRLRLAQAATSLGPGRARAVLNITPTPSPPTSLIHSDPATDAAHKHTPLSSAAVASRAPISTVPLVHTNNGSLTPGIGDPTTSHPPSLQPCGHTLRSSALLTLRPAAALLPGQVQELIRALVQVVHAAPCDVGTWYLLALLSLQQAEDHGSCTLYRKAFTRTRVALGHAERAFAAATAAATAAADAPTDAATYKSSTHDTQPAAGPAPALLAGVVLRLRVVLSECMLHSRSQGCHARAKDAATDALRWALQHSLSPAIAHRQLGRVAVVSGDLANADLAFSNAGTTPDALPAVLDYLHTFLHTGTHTLPEGLVRALTALKEQQPPMTASDAAAAATTPPAAEPPSGLLATSQLMQLAQAVYVQGDLAVAREQLQDINKETKLPVAAQAAGFVLQSSIAAQMAYQALRNHQHPEGEHQQAAGAPAHHQLALEAKWAASSALKLSPPTYKLAAATPAGAVGSEAEEQLGGRKVVLQQAPASSTRCLAAACLSTAEVLLGKKDKAVLSLQQAVDACPSPQAAARLFQLQVTHPLTGQALGARRAAAHAVHLDPSSQAAWQLLKAVAARA